jgi:hypothetical protein
MRTPERRERRTVMPSARFRLFLRTQRSPSIRMVAVAAHPPRRQIDSMAENTSRRTRMDGGLRGADELPERQQRGA